MSRINYSRNSQTDYSFCEDKENLCPNPLQELSKVLKRHYQLHLKNAHTIRQQASQIHRMQQAITTIQSKLTGRHANSISSISGRDSHYHHSIEYFPRQPTSSKQSTNSHQSSRLNTASITSKQGKKPTNQSASSSNSSSPGSNAKLLSSIVERKLSIEKCKMDVT
jgi:hypothetical protein